MLCLLRSSPLHLNTYLYIIKLLASRLLVQNTVKYDVAYSTHLVNFDFEPLSNVLQLSNKINLQGLLKILYVNKLFTGSLTKISFRWCPLNPILEWKIWISNHYVNTLFYCLYHYLWHTLKQFYTIKKIGNKTCLLSQTTFWLIEMSQILKLSATDTIK